MSDFQDIDAGAADPSMLTMSASEAIQALQESESRFHDIADRIEEGLWVRSFDGTKCLYLNPAFEQIWGRSLEDMNNTTWKDTVHVDDQDAAYQFYLSHQNSAKDYRQNYRVMRPDGEVRWIENQGYSILDAEGRLLRMAGIVRDVTQQRKMDEELLLAQKLRSLATLSTGLAHEINTPCQYVSDNISFFAESMGDFKKIHEAFKPLFETMKTDKIDKAQLESLQKLYEEADLDYLLEEIPVALAQSKSGMDQIKKIVTAMKGFSHPGTDSEVSDLNETISNAVVIATSEWKYVAEMHTDFDDGLPLVKIVPSRISQVILNLITNAAHAVGDMVTDGELGAITIKTFAENDYAVIKITDTGSGIPQNVIENIFDPFFTTKGVGKGTGQGLSITHKIIREEHGGKINVESTVNQGTCFTISLPINK